MVLRVPYFMRNYFLYKCKYKVNLCSSLGYILHLPAEYSKKICSDRFKSSLGLQIFLVYNKFIFIIYIANKILEIVLLFRKSTHLSSCILAQLTNTTLHLTHLRSPCDHACITCID